MRSISNIQDETRREYIEKHIPEAYWRYLGCDEFGRYAVNYENYLEFMHYVADDKDSGFFRNQLHRYFNDIDEMAPDVSKWSNATLLAKQLMSPSRFYRGIRKLTSQLLWFNSEAKKEGLMFLNYVVDANNVEDCQDLLFTLDNIYPALYQFLAADSEERASAM